MSVGTVLAGRFELTRLLGRGGMGEVWGARDRTLDRDVAIKLLLAPLATNATFVARFEQEARRAAGLNHPNIVAVYDHGSHEGQPYIVMEVVRGRSLAEAIAAGGLTEDRALEVAADVCAALSYAHSRGLVHRDIKPGNIMLAEDGTVKVTDFGIAYAITGETITQTAAVLGTAAYLSPEQAQGLDLDARSDVYNLGVVLYEVLTGRKPFEGDSAVTVAYQHVQEAPTPPRDLEPSIDPAVEAITIKALAKNPANRYGEADAMRRDLLNALSGRPVAAPAVLHAEDTALLDAVPGTVRTVRGADDERRRRGATYAVVAVLSVIAAALAVWYLASVLAGTDEGGSFPVPEVVGRELAEAERILEARGLSAVVVDQVFSDEFEAGRVVAQDPSEGDRVAEGAVVRLTVSRGRQQVEVPDVRGETEEDARRILSEAGFTPVLENRESSSEVEEGRILRTSPSAGTTLPTGSRITYVVSAGEETVRVRPVVGQTESDATFELEEQGFDVLVTYEFDDVVQEGIVIRQDPAPSTELARGAEVTIVVSRGPEPQPTTSPTPGPQPSPSPSPQP